MKDALDIGTVLGFAGLAIAGAGIMYRFLMLLLDRWLLQQVRASDRGHPIDAVSMIVSPHGVHTRKVTVSTPDGHVRTLNIDHDDLTVDEAVELIEGLEEDDSDAQGQQSHKRRLAER
jgi:hypothetical protein